MTADLEIIDGKASFAYNVGEGAPWHGLGTAVEGLQTAEDMLRIAKADYTVTLQPVFIADTDGNMVEVKDRFATTRVNHDGTVQAFEVMKKRYRVVQNKAVLDKALAVVGASAGDAVIETVGVLNDGRQFFSTIDLGTLFVDPTGVNDKIDRYLLVQTSHDGTTPIVYANTEIRAVCANTVRLGIQTARSVFKARHTPNVDSALEEAQKVLRISTEWGETFAREAERLLAIDVPLNSRKVDRVLNTLWNPLDADTDRKADNRDAKVTDVRNRFANDRNAGAVGENGWGLFNAIVEHLDYGKGGSEQARAVASMNVASLVSQEKRRAHDAVLELV